MASKVIVPLKKKEPAPVVAVGEHEFTLRMSLSDIAIEATALAVQVEEKRDKAARFEQFVPGGNEAPEETAEKAPMSPEEERALIEVAKLTTDIFSAPRKFIDKMLGEGAYEKITDGNIYELDDDIEIVNQLVGAITKALGDERRRKNMLAGSKKSKAVT